MEPEHIKVESCYHNNLIMQGVVAGVAEASSPMHQKFV